MCAVRVIVEITDCIFGRRIHHNLAGHRPRLAIIIIIIISDVIVIVNDTAPRDNVVIFISSTKRYRDN